MFEYRQLSLVSKIFINKNIAMQKRGNGTELESWESVLAKK